jgi:hypothetical protein
MTVFTEADRFERVVRTDDSGARHEIGSATESLLPDGDDERTIVGYSAPGWKICDRLDIMGFNLKATRQVFDIGIAARVKELRSWTEEGPSYEYMYGGELTQLSKLSFEDWLSTFAGLVSQKLYLWQMSHWRSDPAALDLSPLESYMLDEVPSKHNLGFPNSDIRYLLRAAIEACGRDVVVEQDLTDVVEAGY